jgi:predicted amidophosphoribosyltransferase
MVEVCRNCLQSLRPVDRHCPRCREMLNQIGVVSVSYTKPTKDLVVTKTVIVQEGNDEQ